MSERSDRLERLFDAGDHGAARRLAVELRADPAASAADREGADALLARIAPDRGVVVAGLAGTVTATLIAAWLLLH